MSNAAERHRSTRPLAVTDRPYGQRQLILVVEDAVAVADLEARRAAAEVQPEDVKWDDLSEHVLRIASKTLSTPGTVLLVEAVKALYKLRQQGHDALLVGRSEAEALKFPVGHPRPKVLYVGHPGERNTYYTAAQFHHATFDHKSAEAIGLLMALGATDVDVTHVRGYGADVVANVGGKDFRAPVQIKTRLTRGRHRAREFRFSAKLTGQHSPRIPDGLVWFPHEDNWKEIAKARLEFGLKEFMLLVRYEDDFGIDGDFKATAGKSGFELGGKFASFEQTVWIMEGKFQGRRRR
jgi:hypothetical protein